MRLIRDTIGDRPDGPNSRTPAVGPGKRRGPHGGVPFDREVLRGRLGVYLVGNQVGLVVGTGSYNVGSCAAGANGAGRATFRVRLVLAADRRTALRRTGDFRRLAVRRFVALAALVLRFAGRARLFFATLIPSLCMLISPPSVRGAFAEVLPGLIPGGTWGPDPNPRRSPRPIRWLVGAGVPASVELTAQLDRSPFRPA